MRHQAETRRQLAELVVGVHWQACAQITLAQMRPARLQSAATGLITSR